MIIFGGITGVTHERNDLLFYAFNEGKWQSVWENDTSKKNKNILENLKFNLSKKKSMKPERRTEKNKTTFRVVDKPITTMRKYRRPLR